MIKRVAASTRWGAAAILAATALAACTGGSSSSSGSPSGSGAAPSGSGSGAVTPGVSTGTPTSGNPTPTGSASNIDQQAPTAPVIRNGKTPTPTVSASSAPFARGKKVAYNDGVTLQITSIRQGAVKADGSKVIAGPKTTFSLTFKNGSSKAITLDQVVVSASYGAGLAARPVYDDTDTTLRDFSGTVRPGRSATAVYAFSIPTSQLSRVTMRVDFDAIHVAARFTGRVQVR